MNKYSVIVEVSYVKMHFDFKEPVAAIAFMDTFLNNVRVDREDDGEVSVRMERITVYEEKKED